MSNIPEARRILREALELFPDVETLYDAIDEALPHLDRKKPAFVAPRKVRALTPYNKERARALRATGMSNNDIARLLNTNAGRISEAINE